MSNQNDKPWAGRFTEGTDAFVEAFTASVGFDKRLYRHDIAGSVAHARMLNKIGVLTAKECEAIINGLADLQLEIEQGQFAWSVALEDVHMNIEARLTDRIGDAGKKLHTGRSRNDQVATDIRLYLRDEIDAILIELTRLQTGLIEVAEREVETILPGFTHLQTAQPISFGHHMLAWFEMLKRDAERLRDCRVRVNRMPLGSAALAGTTYPIDRAYTAELLGVTDKIHKPLFERIHKEKKPIRNLGQLKDFFIAQGVSAQDFDDTYKSFAVITKTNRAKQAANLYGIKGVPALVVNGKYRTSARDAGSNKRMLEVVDFLVERERAAKSGKAQATAK